MKRLSKTKIVAIGLVLGLVYLFLSDCGTNSITVINGASRELDLTLRIDGKVVWAGRLESSKIDTLTFLHPGSEATFDVEVRDPGSDYHYRREDGYVLPHDGYRHVFLFNHDGIHYALTFKSTWLGFISFGIERFFGKYFAKVACAGPDWL